MSIFRNEHSNALNSRFSPPTRAQLYQKKVIIELILKVSVNIPNIKNVAKAVSVY